MLKHASICRTKRAQDALGNHWDHADTSVHDTLRLAASPDLSSVTRVQSIDNDTNGGTQNNFSSLANGNWLLNPLEAFRTTSSCSSPTPSLQSTTISRIGSISSAPSSAFNSPRKSGTSPTTRCSSNSTIKVYAQTLGQEVEYLTLPVDAQTQSRHIIRALLKKFRLKHRDPNLFYLTLERWIRKDGLRQKSVMLLADEACPLQLQQCCSNPPHNDIKFTLQMKAGALVKIFCQDVCPNTKYKCISLSAQTTVAETIELMLHCLDLVHQTDPKKNDTSYRSTNSSTMPNQPRQTSTPDSTSSSSSSTSSSSGIESDPTSNQNNYSVPSIAQTNDNGPLETSSRAGSVVSITSASDMLNASSHQAICELYCLIIECADTDYRRVLESDEYLVDVYQNLLEEVREQPSAKPLYAADSWANGVTMTSIDSSHPSTKQLPEQWFVIKLKRRDELNHRGPKFTNPRQNMPLPPIPLSLAQINNSDHLQNFVSTTQIEVNNHHQHRPSSSLAIISIAAHKSAIDGINSSSSKSGETITTMDSNRSVNFHQRHMSAVVTSNSSENKTQPPPEHLIWMPQVKPRRRNLTNASSTFGTSIGAGCSRRRYDPAQLVEDLNQLHLASADSHGNVAPTVDHSTLK